MKRLLRRVAELTILPWPLCGWPLYYWEKWGGCCGCGTRFGDVLTGPSEGAPRGEHYCWQCFDEPPAVAEYRVLRERT